VVWSVVNYAFIICNGLDWKNNEIAKNVKNGVKSNAFLLAMQVIWGATTLSITTFSITILGIKGL
jgi:hypothetical protein